MKFVEPIWDLNKISSMKKILLAKREREYLLFVIGINSPYRISDLIRIQYNHVMDEKKKIEWPFQKGLKNPLKFMCETITRAIQMIFYLKAGKGLINQLVGYKRGEL